MRACVYHYAAWVESPIELARFLLHSRDINFSPDAKAELKGMYHNHFGAVFSWFGPSCCVATCAVASGDLHSRSISGPIEDYARLWLSGRAKPPLSEVADVFADAAWASVAG